MLGKELLFDQSTARTKDKLTKIKINRQLGAKKVDYFLSITIEINLIVNSRIHCCEL